MKLMTEDEFDEKFTTVTPLDENGYEDDTIRPTDEGLDKESKHLWTIVEGDNGLYALTGWAKVNAIGYILTEEAWEEDIEAVWQTHSDDDDDDEELAEE